MFAITKLGSSTGCYLQPFTGAAATGTLTETTAQLVYRGTVWAWGDDTYGQLGDGYCGNWGDHSPFPSRVHSPDNTGFLTDIIAVTAGERHTVALRKDPETNVTTVWAWGLGNYGQVGNGNNDGSNLPVQVKVSATEYLTDVKALSAGANHTMALKNDGTVWAWGYNGEGQLGLGVADRGRNYAVQVSVLSNVTAVAAGTYHTVALAGGLVWAWGENGNNQLGDVADANFVDMYVPTRVRGLSGVTAVAAGDAHTIVIDSSQGVWSWGWNGCGQLGDGTATSRKLAVRAQDSSGYLTGVTTVGAGGGHTLAARAGGAVAWGGNGKGELGVGYESEYKALASLVGAPGYPLTGVTALAAGRRWTDDFGGCYNNPYSMALKDDGTVWGWGLRFSGVNFGTEKGPLLPTRVHSPMDTSFFGNATAIAAGAAHMVAVANINSLTVEEGSGSDFLLPGAVVRISAENKELYNYVFATWSGDVAGVANVLDATTDFTMGSTDVTVTATYVSAYNLSVSGGSGGGLYPEGTVVTVVAEPPDGMVFLFWDGDVLDPDSATTTYTMGSSWDVLVAIFGYNLAVIGGTGSGDYYESTSVDISATVPPGMRFVEWTGDIDYVGDYQDATTTITMYGKYSVTATFENVDVDVTGTLSRDWVYQNTTTTTSNRHLVYLSVAVTGSTNYTVGVTKDAVSVGDVDIESTVDPLVWIIRGSARQAGGAVDTGLVKLNVTITDTQNGAIGTAQVEVTSRKLGDIDGAGGVSGQDKLLMNKRLNGLVPDGPQYDLDGAGGASGQDKLILNKILNGIAIP